MTQVWLTIVTLIVSLTVSLIGGAASLTRLYSRVDAAEQAVVRLGSAHAEAERARMADKLETIRAMNDASVRMAEVSERLRGLQVR
jgi:hypothetical protein